MIPGEYMLAKGNIKCNVGRKTIKITVINTGDRPVQIGSHFHFFEVNKQMEFDRCRVLAYDKYENEEIKQKAIKNLSAQNFKNKSA